MKKSIIAASAASLGLAAMPVVSTFATITGTPKVDQFQLTVADQCTLTRKATPHTAPSKTGLSGNSWTTSGSETDVFEATVTPGLAYDGIATSAYNVACNHSSGYQVAVTPSAFEVSTGTASSWPYSATGAYASTGSSWYLTSNGIGASSPVAATSTNIVVTEDGEATSTDFTITYNVNVDAGQETGLYTASAQYVLTEI